ncbi:hypothetical protein Leryth_011681 [Lithospermum erythrorhizon]|nr:hypothetical protein Leryth_011681 [Lithospermum erythrorhizon]
MIKTWASLPIFSVSSYLCWCNSLSLCNGRPKI